MVGMNIWPQSHRVVRLTTKDRSAVEKEGERDREAWRETI